MLNNLTRLGLEALLQYNNKNYKVLTTKAREQIIQALPQPSNIEFDNLQPRRGQSSI